MRFYPIAHRFYFDEKIEIDNLRKFDTEVAQNSALFLTDILECNINIWEYKTIRNKGKFYFEEYKCENENKFEINILFRPDHYDIISNNLINKENMDNIKTSTKEQINNFKCSHKKNGNIYTTPCKHQYCFNCIFEKYTKNVFPCDFCGNKLETAQVMKWLDKNH